MSHWLRPGRPRPGHRALDGIQGRRYDNAVAASFFATLKKELVHRRLWPPRHELPARSSSTSRPSTTAFAGTPRSGCSRPWSSRTPLAATRTWPRRYAARTYPQRSSTSTANPESPNLSGEAGELQHDRKSLKPPDATKPASAGFAQQPLSRGFRRSGVSRASGSADRHITGVRARLDGMGRAVVADDPVHRRVAGIRVRVERVLAARQRDIDVARVAVRFDGRR
jgi:hypothetical protein